MVDLDALTRQPVSKVYMFILYVYDLCSFYFFSRKTVSVVQ
jgi:hypothetical protein